MAKISSQNGNAPRPNKNDLKSSVAMSFASEHESFSKTISLKMANMNGSCGLWQAMFQGCEHPTLIETNNIFAPGK